MNSLIDKKQLFTLVLAFVVIAVVNTYVLKKYLKLTAPTAGI